MTAEPRHERDGDLNRTAHNAITDQAAQLLATVPHFIEQHDGGTGCACRDCAWTSSALAVLREVARG